MFPIEMNVTTIAFLKQIREDLCVMQLVNEKVRGWWIS